MRILIVNTSENTGGAAVAANRLMVALNNNGVKAKMLVKEKSTDKLTVVGLKHPWRQQWHFLWERFCIWLSMHLKKKRLFEVDIANSGTDITSLPEFQEADVIHLHWVNQGMLSLKDIRKIIEKKPVVWTMHDLWAATAICHYARGCEQYHSACQDCPLLPSPSKNDLSHRVWKRKEKMYENKRITLVACSEWLAGEARKSALLKNQRIVSIPNAIDSQQFCPQDKQLARKTLSLPTDKRIILFVSQRVTDPRKGMNFFVEAIQQLADADPSFKEHTGVAILGGHAEEVASQLAIPAYPLGYVSDPQRIVQVYNAADVFVLPSLEDNLPNTIMEAMTCGVPCVGFRVGGIPEMIDHQVNGYVAEVRQTDDLAHGIRYVLDEADYASLSKNCLKKVASHYSQQSVANKFIKVYNEAIRPVEYRR